MSNSSPRTEFENILETMQSKKGNNSGLQNSKQGSKTTQKSSMMPKSGEIFESLMIQNDDLNEAMKKITNDISDIRLNHKESFTNNLTFTLTFSALEVSIKEYEYQSTLFRGYATLYDEMCNEENIVKVLDLLRLIITDRRAILNDIINNILKVQRLDNDRIKMDKAINTDDDLMDSMISPDSL